MAPQIQTTDWRSIAEQASTEMDSGKLATLVAELCRVLDGDPRRMKIPVAANQAMAIAFVGANEHPPRPGTVRNLLRRFPRCCPSDWNPPFHPRTVESNRD